MRVAEEALAGAAGSTTLMLGYGSVPEPAIASGVGEIAEAVRAANAGLPRGASPDHSG